MGKLTHIVKGPMASFRSADKADIESLKLHFLPKQEGSGDPSPTNIRPITGWTGLDIYHSGKNLINYNEITDTDVGTDINGQRKAIKFTKAGTYYIKSFNTWSSDSYIYARIKNADGTFGNIIYIVANRTVTNKIITITEGQTLYIFNASSGLYGTVEATIDRLNDWGIVVSFENLTEYADCLQNSIISIEFPNSTVYGGYVDLVRGKVVATHILYNEKWSNLTYRTQKEEIIGKYYDCPYPIKATNTTPPQIKMCNVAKWLWQDTQSTDPHYYIQRTTNGLYRLYVYLPINFDDNAYVQVILELETPIEYNLTPEQLKSFKGTNNIWSDANGNVEIKYWTH